VPQVRGPVRSLPLPFVLAQAEGLIAAGHREIVLSGIHIGAYGQGLPDGVDLADAIKALLALPNLGRLRLSSLEPQHFDPKLLALLKDQAKLCPHFHIPLQSGCDKTLKAMGRRYSLSQYQAVLNSLRSILPDPAITTDIIAGYPGESEEDFFQTLDFIKGLAFAGLHIFPYSPRPGTPAASLPDQVRPEDKQRRAEELDIIGKILQENYAKKYLGQELRVLAEQQLEQDGQIYWSGHSANYLQVLWPSGEVSRGEFQVVIGKEYRDGCIFAE
ncbi:MAG: radical SAM protein, partial [Clostridiales bacterium]|nr:radical SAM protein [Clostridiales bacterium]